MSFILDDTQFLLEDTEFYTEEECNGYKSNYSTESSISSLEDEYFKEVV